MELSNFCLFILKDLYFYLFEREREVVRAHKQGRGTRKGREADPY